MLPVSPDNQVACVDQIISSHCNNIFERSSVRGLLITVKASRMYWSYMMETHYFAGIVDAGIARLREAERAHTEAVM